MLTDSRSSATAPGSAAEVGSRPGAPASRPRHARRRRRGKRSDRSAPRPRGRGSPGAGRGDAALAEPSRTAAWSGTRRPLMRPWGRGRRPVRRHHARRAGRGRRATVRGRFVTRRRHPRDSVGRPCSACLPAGGRVPTGEAAATRSPVPGAVPGALAATEIRACSSPGRARRVHRVEARHRRRHDRGFRRRRLYAVRARRMIHPAH